MYSGAGLSSPATPAAANGRHFWKTTVSIMTAVGAVLTFLYLGLSLGATSERVTTVERRLQEEIPRAAVTHDAIESRTDAKLAQQRELILSKLDEIIRRLDRLERRP